jgi:hypothetical protein
MVIFTEEALKSELEPFFINRQHIKLIVLPFEDFAYLNQVDTLRSNAVKNPFKTDSPHKTTVFYTILMWNKFTLVQKAYELFPNYKNYVWIDFGLGYVVGKNPCNINDVLNTFDADHFSCTIINPMDSYEFNSLEESFGSWKYRQVGGFWSIGKQCIEFFMQFIHEQIDMILKTERICADEEIMARFSFAHPDKCVFSFGDYASCVCNWLNMTNDLHVAVTAINKCHIHSLHHMAYQGVSKILDVFNRGLISISKPDVVKFMFMYYIESFYVRHDMARKIAIHFLLCAHIDPCFAEFLSEKRNEIKQQFTFVMTETEFENFSPPSTSSQSLSYNVFKRLVSESPPSFN